MLESNDDGPPEGFPPKSTWLPIYNTRTPYNEDEIVMLISDIVRLFLKLSFVRDEQVIWPPEGGHAINEHLARELDVSDQVISLLKRLPYSDSFYTGKILLDYFSPMINYLDDDSLRYHRRTFLGGPNEDAEEDAEEDSTKLLPQDVVLSAGDSMSAHLILDVFENTVRVGVIADVGEGIDPPGAPQERPGKNHYRNHWPRHAPSFLRVLRYRIQSLDAIPPGEWAHSDCYIDEEYEWLRRKIKHILIGTYGWPDQFQQAAWDKDREEVWEKAVEEWRKVGSPSFMKFEPDKTVMTEEQRQDIERQMRERRQMGERQHESQEEEMVVTFTKLAN